MTQHYTSGNWHVRAGSEDEFIKRWVDFIEQTKDITVAHFDLMRDDGDSKHFVSVGTWPNKADIGTWMGTPNFKDAFASFRDLCDEYTGGPYTHVTSVGE